MTVRCKPLLYVAVVVGRGSTCGIIPLLTYTGLIAVVVFVDGVCNDGFVVLSFLFLCIIHLQVISHSLCPFPFSPPNLITYGQGTQSPGFMGYNDGK